MKFLLAAFAILFSLAIPSSNQAVVAQDRGESPGAPQQATDADLIDLADEAEIVLKARVRRQSEVERERSFGLRPGYVRFYIEAQTANLIAGSTPVGERIRYLVDLPVDSRGRAPRVRGDDVLIFARPVPRRPGEIQLVAPDAQLAWNPSLEQRTRLILEQLLAPDAPPKIVGVRDALSVAGTLAGESETQIFLATRSGAPAAISVVRRPNMAPAWGVSFSEIIDQAAAVPARETLAWYRLTCALPAGLPGEANLARDPADRARAAEDYRYVIGQLGQCPRLRTPPPTM